MIIYEKYIKVNTILDRLNKILYFKLKIVNIPFYLVTKVKIKTKDEKECFLMKKLNDKLVKKLYKLDLAKDELLLLMYVIQCSNKNGFAHIHYKEVAKVIGCCQSNVYRVLSSLKYKLLIDNNKNKECRQEISVKFIDNDFDFEQLTSYLDVNFKVFDMDILRNLRAGSIRTLLYFVFRMNKQRKVVDFNNTNKLTYNNFKAMSRELNITERMLKEYFKELKENQILNIVIKKDKNNKSFKIIEIFNDLLNKPKIQVTEKGVVIEKEENSAHRYYKNIVVNLCRRHKLSYTELDLNDTAMLMNQYWAIANKKDKDIVKLITVAFKSIKDKLNSIIIHNVIKSLLNHNMNNKIIAY